MKWGEHAGTYTAHYHHDDRPQIHRLYLHYFTHSACTQRTQVKAGTHAEERNQTLNRHAAGRQISPSSPHCNRRSNCCHTLRTSALRILPAHTADKLIQETIQPHYVRPLCFMRRILFRIKLFTLGWHRSSHMSQRADVLIPLIGEKNKSLTSHLAVWSITDLCTI